MSETDIGINSARYVSAYRGFACVSALRKAFRTDKVLIEVALLDCSQGVDSTEGGPWRKTQNRRRKVLPETHLLQS